MAKINSDRKIIDKVFVLLGAAAALLLVVVGSIAWYAHNFAFDSVKTELTAQAIYFPSKGSSALNPDEFPGLQQYAGQIVDTGPKAKAYANEYIAVHLTKVADGKTYAQVSTAAMKDPTNAKLQAQKQTLFQGETLRGLLLGDGYAYWTFGQIAMWAAWAAWAAAAVMAVLVSLGFQHMSRQK